MMEKVDRAGQEEFIWAMRMRLGLATEEDSSSSWRDRLYSKTSLDTNLSIKLSESRTDIQTKVLASLVPDEVIYDCNNYEPRPYEACILYGQISGFDLLYQKFNSSMSGVSTHLTQILNTYLGSMIQEILLFYGDVIKLNGDNIIAMWKPGVNNQSMPDCVHQAIDCSLSIQKICGFYEVDADITLKAKMIIMSGEVIFKLVGDERQSYYVVYGPSIANILSAHKIIVGGEIAISASAGDYININEYLYELIDDRNYAKILGAAAAWRSSQRNFGRQEYSELHATITPPDKFNSTIEMTEPNAAAQVFELRPALALAVDMDLNEDLKRFIIPSVIRGIEMDEPIDYLTEMRNIVLLYADVVIENINDELYLKLVDLCYRKLGKIVLQLEGCVSQVFLFEQNARFVITFGFRGFKHNLESRRGLYCAMRCYNTISKVDNVLMVSISVTTGMSYCGAIGHTLRRQYTVISIGANNAAILVEGYPGKITCDRDTFLQSKLDPMQFILQEALLSTSNTGPIYEYIQPTRMTLPNYPISKYPILDRDSEVNVYLKMLNSFILREATVSNLNNQIANKTLVVHGRPKEGKTRLVEEYLYRTPDNIPIFKIHMVPSDRHVPYQAIYNLFSVPLGIKENSTVPDRQAKLTSKLKKYDSPQFFCMLNIVFNVNFEKNAAFNSLTEQQKFYALNKIIKQLCLSCFQRLWVIIIDGVENMDDESWSVIKTIIDTGRIFMVLTLTTSAAMSPIAELVLKSPNIKTIQLFPLDKWYHVGLACQFLKVIGIPAELEKVLHTKSTGNPGWIESYLITLVHSGALIIKSIPLRLIKFYGLVFSPQEMIKRPSNSTHEGSMISTSTRLNKQSNSEIFVNIQDKWKIYKHSFRDSSTDFFSTYHAASMHTVTNSKSTISLNSKLEIKDLADLPKREPMVDICVIQDNANVNDIVPESTLDSFVIKVLDYLTSYEQLLLKCSSVIGETLPRDMLHYLMNREDLKKCALAVKRLFEIGVLGCAHGKFNYGGSNAILNVPEISSSTKIECKCEGLNILDICQDLPKYASCGYLYFKIASFREMTYSLLTLHQRKEFHFKAIRYLEKKTRKCVKCGGGFFPKLMGTQYDEAEKKKKTLSANISISSNYESKKGPARRSMFETGSTTTFKSSFKNSFAGSDEDRYSSRYQDLIRSFSSSDFSNCDCTRILFSMYRQIVEHCEAVGLLDKWLVSNLEYGRLCIDTYNIPLALKVLNKTLNTFKLNHTTIVKVGESWKSPFIKAKILTLIAKARLEVGQIKTSFTLFEEALKNLSYPFPSAKSLKFKLTTFQQYLYLMYDKRCGMKLKHDYTAEYCDNVSECLNLISSLFIQLEMYDQAEVTAMCSLKKVLQSEKNFVILINAFTNIIEIYLMKRKMKYLGPLESKALAYCQSYTSTVDVRDLEAVVQLYGKIFKAKVLRCDFDDAIAIGNLLIKICGSINRKVDVPDLHPLLIHVLFLKNRVYDAVMIFSMVEQASVNDVDFYDLTWFYALCVCFHLDTGYTVVPFKTCENYRYVEAQNYVLAREPTAQKRYYVALWLWLIRNGKFEEAEVWEEKFQKTWTIKKTESLVNLFTALYYLEGLILIMVSKMDHMNNVELDYYFEEINTLINILQYHAQFTKIIEPRLYHLKAYYLLAIQQDDDAYSLLNKARKVAKYTGNIYDENWINHSELAWKQDMSAIDFNFWHDHATMDLQSYHLLENNEKLGYFTLELPLYL